jgi:hypothetical protein
MNYVLEIIAKNAVTVHAAGYDFAASPDRRLLIKELDGVDLTKVELLVIQVQTLVGKPDFKYNVEKVASAVSAENPDCIIMSQVNPSLYNTTQIVQEIDV